MSLISEALQLVIDMMRALIDLGDLAHLALALWAIADLALVVLLLRELSLANRRFDDFVRELAHFNRRHEGEPGPHDGPQPELQSDLHAPKGGET